MLPDWFSLPSFLLGTVFLAVLVALWYGVEDYLLPWMRGRRTERQQNLAIAKRALGKRDPQPGDPGQVEPEVSTPPPLPPDPSGAPAPTPEPATQELGVVRTPRLDQPGEPTQFMAPPEPRGSSRLDLTQPPPPLPAPYQGPERRLRSDNPYPELRRRADDRERQEAEDAEREPAPPVAPRRTRAEERRAREAEEGEK